MQPKAAKRLGYSATVSLADSAQEQRGFRPEQSVLALAIERDMLPRLRWCALPHAP